MAWPPPLLQTSRQAENGQEAWRKPCSSLENGTSTLRLFHVTRRVHGVSRPALPAPAMGATRLQRLRSARPAMEASRGKRRWKRRLCAAGGE